MLGSVLPYLMIKHNHSSQIELNSQFKEALDLIENTSRSVFITGKAGTGKSTLLRYFRKHTAKDVIVLASTGVAALNVGGETIHSFFGFKPDITIDKVKKLKGAKSRSFKKINTIIIDEVSMVRADLLDCVDAFLRLNGKDSH
ncbi:MAG: AAA family ATPase, partial [Elusimicrobiales bacterium]|nr:AAA family ATPase [Elusimicrobiales bacterium]